MYEYGQSDTMLKMIAAICLIITAVFIYFIPYIIAWGHKKKNAGAILALNVFLGWTFVGWVLALVWALTKDER